MELRDCLEILRNRKWLIIQAVVVITAAVVAFSLWQPPVYEAASKVMVNERAVTNLFGQMSFPWRSYNSSIETQMQLVKSPPVAELVVKSLDLSASPESLLGQVQVEQIGETSLIQIRVQDNGPVKASNIANAFALSYVEWSRESSRRESRAVRKELTGEIRDTREDILTIGKKIDNKDENESISEDEKLQLDLATKFYAMLAEKNEELKINERLRSDTINLVAAAPTPNAPISPDPERNGIFGLIVGLIFGCTLALFVEYLDNTLKTPDDVDKYFKLPLLGQIPVEESSGNSSKKEIISHSYGKSTGAEAYRALRTNIQYLNFDQSTQTMIVTSGRPEEGKSTILANLAVTLAQAGTKVIVICCDLRRPSVHKIFHLSNSLGLSDVLAGKCTYESSIQDVSIHNLKVIPSGPLPPNPSELLGSERMKTVISKASDMADIVLIDTPPALAVTDCAVVAPQVDGVMLVASSGHTTREVAKQVIKRLASVNARLLGVVLNNVERDRGYGYYYYYHSHDDVNNQGAGSGNGSQKHRRRTKKRFLSKRKLLVGTMTSIILLSLGYFLFQSRSPLITKALARLSSITEFASIPGD